MFSLQLVKLPPSLHYSLHLPSLHPSHSLASRHLPVKTVARPSSHTNFHTHICSTGEEKRRRKRWKERQGNKRRQRWCLQCVCHLSIKSCFQCCDDFFYLDFLLMALGGLLSLVCSASVIYFNQVRKSTCTPDTQHLNHLKTWNGMGCLQESKLERQNVHFWLWKTCIVKNVRNNRRLAWLIETLVLECMLHHKL